MSDRDRLHSVSEPPPDVELERLVSLLRAENEYLKARTSRIAAEKDSDKVRGMEAHIAHLEQHAAQLQREVNRLEAAGAEGKQARSDLRWLLKRLRRSPLGPLLRTRPGFRKLWDRWGST